MSTPVIGTGGSAAPTENNISIPASLAQANRWELVKFLLPILLPPAISALGVVTWALISMSFAQTASAQKDTIQDAKIEQFQATKETRIAEIATVKTVQEAHGARLTNIEQKQDRIIDLLLARLPPAK